jgi:hypothetical protein
MQMYAPLKGNKTRSSHFTDVMTGWNNTVLHPGAEYCLYSTSEEPADHFSTMRRRNDLSLGLG